MQFPQYHRITRIDLDHHVATAEPITLEVYEEIVQGRIERVRLDVGPTEAILDREELTLLIEDLQRVAEDWDDQC